MLSVYRNPKLASIAALVLSSLPACKCGVSSPPPAPTKGTSVYQLVTGEDIEQDRSRWDSLYEKTQGYVFGKEPAEILKDTIDILPVGRALDIAMGEGRNAVFLAKKGFVVDGVDLSEVAIRKAKRLAKENQVTISTQQADLNAYVIKPETYEVIVNIDFLLRPLIPQIKRGLKRGGVVVFENMTVDQLKNPQSEGMRQDYLLKLGELKELFKDYQIVHYAETNDGKTAKASLIAVKP